MYKYQYTGEAEVSIDGYGLVKPGETIEVDFEINHPEFVEASKDKKKSKDSDE